MGRRRWKRTAVEFISAVGTVSDVVADAEGGDTRLQQLAPYLARPAGCGGGLRWVGMGWGGLG